MSLSPFQRLPAELLVLIYNNLPRIKDAVSLALTCKKTYALFERFEDRAKIIYSIVDNIPISLPAGYPTRSWLEGYFPPHTPFWTPTTAKQMPTELVHEETLAFLRTTGFPIFECERLDFSSRDLELAKPDNNDNGGDEEEEEEEKAPVSESNKHESSRPESPRDDDEEESGKEGDSDSDEQEQGADPLYIGTWFSQHIAVDTTTGKIQHRSWDDEDENEDIAENVGRFLVLLGVIRSTMCDLQISGLQRFRKEQIERDEEVEEVVLEKLFEGLGAFDAFVKEAGAWGWICNYLST